MAKRSTTGLGRPLKVLTQAPAMSLPDFERPFQLYVTKLPGIILGVLAKALGPTKISIGYFSKELDTVAPGLAPLSQGGHSSCSLLEEAFKIPIGQEITLYTSHQIGPLLNTQWPHWLTNNHILY